MNTMNTSGGMQSLNVLEVYGDSRQPVFGNIALELSRKALHQQWPGHKIFTCGDAIPLVGTFPLGPSTQFFKLYIAKDQNLRNIDDSAEDDVSQHISMSEGHVHLVACEPLS